ncbi:hypothetical protein CC78DRAFT_17284 [Lojkania enalia]|uniref:Uncharacterized protein n=1 Tax=Lojkania enalia TaxID=147567 RepID=A0A9P4KFI6_9PLEO|nr:hypothetical protein CC78DRAFT_17284 [Didymosphaeria enalia]
MSLLHVFDLPQLYTKPPAEALLEALALLTSAPPSWECSDTEEQGDGVHKFGMRKAVKPKAVQISPKGVTRYLTSIVSSSLRWISDEGVKEEIWSQASMRLSERSGRTAMGAISRQFRIPSQSGSFQLTVHEPALTGDDLGLKTWAASYLLAKRLHTFDLLKSRNSGKIQVLELGSGTGLVGMAMAGLGADVVLTDLPSIYSNLARNVQDNSAVVHENHGTMRTGLLDWTNPTLCRIFLPGTQTGDDGDDGTLLTEKFPLVLAADSLYSSEHPRLLVETIEAWLSDTSDARVIVEFPFRDAYLPQIDDFRARMGKIGLSIIEEGEEKGYDDWGWAGADDEENDKALVRCWWSCWGRLASATN